MMKAEPQKEHRWLQKFVGNWTYEGEASMGPGQPPSRMTGSESLRSIGGLWVVGEGVGEVPGSGEQTSIFNLGYDPDKKRFVGTWLSSMMTYLWVYDGEPDGRETTLTLNASFPAGRRREAGEVQGRTRV